MTARKLMVLAASLLECHSASALAMPFIGARLPPPALVARSIGAQLANVDPAVWAAGAGVAATVRLQREAVVRIRIDEIRAGGNETGRLGLNLKALAAVLGECKALSEGVLVRCAFELLVVVPGVILLQCVGRNVLNGLNMWPRITRIIVLASIAAVVAFDEIAIDPAERALGFLASGLLFVR